MHARSRPRRAALLAGLALAACRPAAPPPPPVDAPVAAEPPPPARPVDPELAAIADAVDPGEHRPLFVDLPRWLAEPLARRADGESPQGLVDRARDAIAGWEAAQERGAAFTPEALVSLASGLYFGERALVAGRGDDPEIVALLERAYAALDQRFLTHEQGFFRQILQIMIDALAREGVLSRQEQVVEVDDFLREALRRAGPNKRRLAALLLREHPTHPAVPDALLHLARDASDREDYGAALALTRLAIARRAAPEPGDLASLAHRCYEALDLACGDEAGARLAAAPAPVDAAARRRHDERLRAVESAGASAREVVRLGGAAGLDDRLRRGHQLLLLGRFRDAEALYAELRRAHPGDARPLIGQAKLAIQRDLDLFGAAKYVREARSLQSRDREAFEVSLGLATGELMQQVIPRALAGGDAKVDDLVRAFVDELRADVRGWSTYEPGRGAVLGAIVDALAEGLPHFLAGAPARGLPALRRLPGRLGELCKRTPEVRDAWRAAAVSAVFADDRALAQRLVEAPLPPALAGDAELHLARLRAARDLVLLWEPDDAAPRLDALVARLSPELRAHDDAREVRALADGLRGLAGERAAAERSIAAYRDLAATRGGVARTHLLHNAAVLLAGAGDLAAAQALWADALAVADDKQRDFIHLAAAVRVEGLADALGGVAESKNSAALRLQAQAWQVELARRRGDDTRAAVDALRAAYRRERAQELRGATPVGRLGAISSGDFNVHLGYALREGLTLTFELRTTAWLEPPAPIAIAGKR